MTRDEIRQAIVRALGAIAPETDAAAIDPKANLREALDLDSMDFLNFIVALHADLGVDVPEADYRKMSSLDASIDYLASRLRPASG